jgi:hypothetical protein
MGWNTEAVTVLFAGNTIINPSGIFTYSGAPAAGNLIFSSAPAAGTDQFGNPYVEGAAAYSIIAGDTYALQMGTANGFPAFFITNLTTTPSEPPSFTANQASPAGCTALMDSGTSTGASTAAAVLATDSTGSGVAGGEVQISAGSTILNNSGSAIPIANVSLLISPLPNDTNSGSTWVAGERAFMNNNWVALVNQNFNAIIGALQSAGIIT